MQWLINLVKSLFAQKTEKGPIENPELPNHIAKVEPVAPISLVDKKCLEMFEAALKEMGISEYTSEGKKRIAEYHKKGVGKNYDYSTAWCASFTNFIVKSCGLKGTDSAAARSFLKWGVAVTKPVKGCVVVFWRESRDSHLGHVGLYAGETETDIIVLSGNQDNAVNKKKYSKSRLLGYRLPNI